MAIPKIDRTLFDFTSLFRLRMSTNSKQTGKKRNKISLYDAIFTYFGPYYSPVCFYKYVESP